jgi:hypothetical protein
LKAFRLGFVAAVLCVLVFSGLLPFAFSKSVGQGATVSAIADAEQALSQAYEAVLDAEKAGANVSVLLVKLNGGVDSFLDAQRAFESGDDVEAVRLANSASGVAGEVWDEAATLSVEAGDAAVDRSWVFLVVSTVAVSVVAVGSWVGYRFFKQWYYRRLLKMKPKVGKV